MSSTTPNPSPPKNLPALSRHITTHAPNGTAIFSTAIPATLPVTPIPDGADFSLAYTTSTIPASFKNDADIPAYAEFIKPGNSPGLVVKSGSVCRIVDMRPGAISPMHRTVSLDYGVVLEGVVELVLDSGETRVMNRGDVAVQRGTMHAWRNTSDTEWARMLYVLLPAEGVNAGGRELGEELDGMGVPDSK
ncbi:hypothetical protein BJY04DRAFT_222851 [Aspergillus karnatakaensis]|uniref:cupin domain-containing protein n=1 Tax=Aspergillus karnatakaensis TaxID=1810916 RepID=UPI003CCE19D8